ncbi:MAG: MogA/MoaB family molybdenum cofactor biosynthesis protein [Microbacteriaceae bacterium]
MTGTADHGGRCAVVIVASTRAAAGTYQDTTGPVIQDWLRTRGWRTVPTRIVPDGPEVAAALQQAVSEQAALVITTGGTGLSPSDVTAEATATILDKELPGFMEEVRRRGTAHTMHALLSRGLAGVAGQSFVVNLPGSHGAVADGLDVLGGILEHVLDQIAGGSHDA